MLQAFAFEKVGIVLGDLHFLDPLQEGPERGVRLELRAFEHQELKGTVYSATPISVGQPIWRVDLLESDDGSLTKFNRTHYHPKFTLDWDTTNRVYDHELSADPFGWLAGQLADLPGIIERAGFPADIAGPDDAASLKEMAPAIVAATSAMVDKVRAGELGSAPKDAGEFYRVGWM